MKHAYLLIFRTALLFIAFFPVHSSFAQYGPFWPDDRKVTEHSFYDDYLRIIGHFNNNEKDAGSALKALDSLSVEALGKDDYKQFLFFKNEAANFYISESRYGDGYTNLQKATHRFSNHRDTLSVEYVASLRLLRKMGTRSDQASRSEGELFRSQLAILNKLELGGEPLRNTLVDYGLFMSRQGKTQEAISLLYDARTQSLKDDDLASLAVADYTIITKLPPIYDIQKTTMEVLKNDITLFEQSRASVPILTYNAYFNYLVGERNYDYFDDIDQGIRYTKKAIVALDSLPQPVWNLKASCHSNLALMYADLKDTTRMWENFQKAKVIAGTRPMSDYNKTLAFVNIADAGVTASADSAMALLPEIKQQPGAVNFEDKIAEVEAMALQKLGRENEARRLIGDQFEADEEIAGQTIPLISDSLSFLNQIRFFDMLKENYRTSETPVNEDEKHQIVTNIISKQNQLYLEAIKKDVYGHELSSLTRKYHNFLMPSLEYLLSVDDEEASRLIISSKAVQLYNNLVKNRMQSEIDNQPKLLDRLLDKSDAIQEVRNELADEKNDSIRANKLKKELNTLLVDNMVLRYKMNEEGSGKMEEIQIPSMNEIQEKLNPGEGIIEYTISDSTMIWSLITDNQFQTGLKKVDDLPGKISEEIYAIKTGGESTGIGSLLLGDVEEEILKMDHLTIIPDKNLNYIPFEWLVLPESGKMLIEELPVSYNYSSALWHLLRDEPQKPGYLKMLTVAPLFYNPDEETAPSMNYASNYRGSRNIDPLYHSITEVNTIDSIFSVSGNEVFNLVGREAGISNTKQHMAQYDIIHFATHGLINKENPERSGLFLHPGDDNTNAIKEDNFLSMGDIMTMDMRAELVVLSACDTGTGEFAEGEGVLALPRGFILSGVPNVISTLWQVHDEKTKDLMTAFYRHLLAGNSYPQALRLAKLDAIEQGVVPLDWAGIVLMGS
ncbi:MAG: CHAT domain-containing protein [Bacteroidota bacterium]